MRAPVAALLMALAAAPVQAADCPAAPDPVGSLSYGSRYTDDSATRSEIDAKADAEADDALRPIDDFLRDLTAAANTLFEEDTKDKAAVADCLLGQVAEWARAGALGDLQSDTARLTIGSRLAGFALVLGQVAPHATRAEDLADSLAWLTGLMAAQTTFWEVEAPKGARQGNLRAWAALAGAATAALTDDVALRAWATWSVSYVACTAAPDGSLPQEMRRANFALKYQLHAIAPLVVTTLLLDRQGVALLPVCDAALGRIVDFALADLDSGDASRAITGEVQSFFDGSDTVEPFHLAWLEAWLLLDPAAASGRAGAVAEAYRPLNYSKLGGKQGLIWQAP